MRPQAGNGEAPGRPPPTKYFVLRTNKRSTDDLSHHWARGPANLIPVRYLSAVLSCFPPAMPVAVPLGLNSKGGQVPKRYAVLCSPGNAVCLPPYVPTLGI